MTEITGTVLSHDAVEAALARLRAYSDQIDTVVERGSMAAAADMTLVYEAREWVQDLPPVKVARHRGQPIKADSRTRFAQWAAEHPERIGAYSAARLGRLLVAHQLATEYFDRGSIYSETALRPLKRFLKDRQAELPDIARRVKQITDGGPVTENAVKLAVHDHQQSLIPAKAASTGHKTAADRFAERATLIKSEFKTILDTHRFRDAGRLVNELRAMLMEAAGVSGDLLAVSCLCRTDRAPAPIYRAISWATSAR